MPQIISIFLAVLLGFKDLFSSKKTGKTDETLKNIVVGVVVYFLLNRFLDKQAKADLLANSANDPNATFAIRLHNALVPSGINWINNIFGDSTDETEITAVAVEMSRLKNFTVVATKYQTIYGSDLATDLEKDGVYALFNQSYVTGSNGGGSTGGGGVSNPLYIKKGDTVYSKGGYNLRSSNSPYGAETTTIAGQDWLVNRLFSATIAGTKGVWVEIQQPKNRYWIIPSKYVIISTALYKK